MPSITPTPFLPSFSQAEVDRMMRKVRDHRLPSTSIVPSAGWDYGLDLDWLKDLKRVWEEEWSWEETKKDIERFPHFCVEIEDINLHFVHVKSKQPDAIPLVLCHGWPSTFLEFWEVVEPLNNPFDGQQAFDVVIPSLPGYAFSSPPMKAWTASDTARVYNTLMVDVLGYKTYGAVGGDLGTRVLTKLLRQFPKNAVAAHYTMLYGKPPFGFLFDLLPLPTFVLNWWKQLGVTDPERNALRGQERFLSNGKGYNILQKTRPATIGYALYDNPVGILAYIGEKYKEWSDPNADSLPSHLDANHILAQVSIYHLTSTIHTSFLPYRHYGEGCTGIPTNIDVPIGYSANPYDIHHFPRTWLNQTLNSLVFYRLHERGGHFAAQDTPEDFVEDVREMVSCTSEKSRRRKRTRRDD